MLYSLFIYYVYNQKDTRLRRKQYKYKQSIILFQLCITKHAPDITLKVSDISVKPLWQNTKVHNLLNSLGFQQIGLLLNFTSIPSNRRLLTAALQLFISLSTHKTPMMLHKLDVNLLGGPHSNTKVSVCICSTGFHPFNPLY